MQPWKEESERANRENEKVCVRKKNVWERVRATERKRKDLNRGS